MHLIPTRKWTQRGIAAHPLRVLSVAPYATDFALLAPCQKTKPKGLRHALHVNVGSWVLRLPDIFPIIRSDRYFLETYGSNPV